MQLAGRLVAQHVGAGRQRRHGVAPGRVARVRQDTAGGLEPQADRRDGVVDGGGAPGARSEPLLVEVGDGSGTALVRVFTAPLSLRVLPPLRVSARQRGGA